MLNMLPDIRNGGKLQYIATRANKLMRVPDHVKDSVGFLGYSDFNDEYKLAGTAFFFSLKDDDEETDDKYAFPYIITARHVIEGIQQHGSAERVYLRTNTKDGGHAFIVSEVADWYFDPDDHVIDVAVLPIFNPQLIETFSVHWIQSDIAVTDLMIEMEGLGVGDDTFITGLFVNHYGKQRNIPIVRVGTIAAMPGEKVATARGDMDAYLVEVRSIGGISGSPVFSSLGPVRANLFEQYVGYRFNFLGLVHGHWDLVDSDNDASSRFIDRKERINQGIAIVVPASKIVQVLNQPELVKMRKKIKDGLREYKKKHLPTMDSNIKPDAQNEDALTREAFERTLKQVDRKTSEPES